MNPKKYKFKVLTMSDKVVTEAYSFNHLQHNGGTDDAHSADHTQTLILSRDLEKMMEIYSDSRCRIYKKYQETGKKQIEWKILHQIKKYPTPLQGLTNANFLFSPDLTHFIDVAVIRS
jgi:hypothetical protein